MSSITIPELVHIPAGSFWMGSVANDPVANKNEKPMHKVFEEESSAFKSFKIGKYPVTNSQYSEYIQENIKRNPNLNIPLHWNHDYPPNDIGNHPVTNVHLTEANSYCDWLNQYSWWTFRIPTEYHWEKAARGIEDSRIYVWGNQWKSHFCNTKELGLGQTTSITRFGGI